MYKKIFSITIIFSILSTIYSQEPQDPPSGYIQNSLLSYKLKASIIIPSVATGGLILISEAPFSGVDVSDNYNYKKGEYIGNAKVLKYISNNNAQIEINGLLANKKYYIGIYSYNQVNGKNFYNKSPYKTSFTTKGKEIGNYYNSIDVNSPNFLSELTKLINKHIHISYDDYDTRMVDNFLSKDTLENLTEKKYVICEYTNEILLYTGAFNFTKFNREHIIPKNWMNFRGIPNSDIVNFPEGADFHNLALTEINANSKRQDFILDNVINTTKTYKDAKFGTNANSSFCFEPKSSFKGNAARSMFYQIVCYNNQQSTNWGFNSLKGFASDQNQEVLKSWANTDTVDDYEISRHEYIYSLQANRNPFIDFPSWIDCINFDDIVILKKCDSINQNVNINILTKKIDLIYSIEKNILTYKYNNNINSNEIINIYDITGNNIFSKNIESKEGTNSNVLTLDFLNHGVYFLKLIVQDYQYNLKFIIE